MDKQNFQGGLCEITMNKINDLVSIIVPVYNTASYLSECIDSLLAQDYEKIEVICVDDGSSDNSVQILYYYQNQDSRVKVFQCKHSGQSAARNMALSYAKGKYVCFVDSDDYIIPNAITQCIETIYKRKVDIVLFNLEAFTQDGSHWPCLYGNYYWGKKPIVDCMSDERCINFTNAVSCFVRKSIIDNNCIKFPEGMIYEDWVFMMQLCLSGNYKVFKMNSPLYWYRRGVANSTTTIVNEKCLDIFKAYEKAEEVINNAGVGARWNLINDTKIVEEGLALLKNRVILYGKEDIKNRYITCFCQILKKFDASYLNQVVVNMQKRDKSIIWLLYNDKNVKSYKSVFSMRNRVVRTNIIYSLLKKIKTYMLKVYRCISPTYRAICTVRDELRELNVYFYKR